MRIFGIDPGSIRTGYGCVETDGGRHRFVACGALSTPAGTELPARLLAIHAGLTEAISASAPDCVAIENLFHARNARSALILGHARGVAVLAAAVADFRPTKVSVHKIKKETLPAEGMTLQLERNPDILAELGARDSGGILVGFALETEDAVRNAREKLERKRADMIVLNNPLEEGAAFGGDTNVATFLFADGSTEELGLLSKADLAHALLDRAVYLLASRTSA